MTHHHDLLERVARLRLTDAEISEQWSLERQRQMLVQIGSEGAAAPRRHRRRWLAAGAVTVAAAVVATVIVGVMTPEGSPGGPSPAAAAALEQLARVASTAAAPVVGPGRYAYSVVEALHLHRGRMVHDETNRLWIDSHGYGRYVYSGFRPTPECGRIRPLPAESPGNPDFGAPTLALINSLPRDPARLDSYISSNVHGERNNAEAVFVAVADLLRDGSGLTSAQIRSSLIAVLARTPFVTVRRGVFDERGRPATRVIFSDPHGLPPSVESSYHSMYFDPATAQLLEEQDGGVSTDGSVGRDVAVYTARRVVDHVPGKFVDC